MAKRHNLKLRHTPAIAIGTKVRHSIFPEDSNAHWGTGTVTAHDLYECNKPLIVTSDSDGARAYFHIEQVEVVTEVAA